MTRIDAELFPVAIVFVSYSCVSPLKVLAERYYCLFRLGGVSICDFDFVVQNNEIQGSFGLTMWTLLSKNLISLLVLGDLSNAFSTSCFVSQLPLVLVM